MDFNVAQRIDEKLAKHPHPQADVIDSLSLFEDDAIFLCAGFEERTTHVLDYILRNSSNKFTVYLCKYSPFIPENRLNDLVNICNCRSIRYKVVEFDRQSPELIASDLDLVFSRTNGRVFFDVSSMSKLLIVQSIVASSVSKKKFADFYLIYTQASFYMPREEDIKFDPSSDSFYRGLLISNGVFEAVAVPQLSSTAMQGQPRRLVTFPSFNTDQLRVLRQEIQPWFFSLIFENSPLEQYSWRNKALRSINFIDDIYPKEEYSSHPLAFGDTLATLLRIYQEYNSFQKIIIAPTGSKMQAVGVGIFRAFMLDVQIVYPTPRVFCNPKNYTSGIDCVQIIDLSSYSDL